MEKLQRSKEDRIIVGVCGGLAKYFGVDSTLIRLIFIVGAFLKGVTILIYLVLAIIMPEEDVKKIKGVEEKRVGGVSDPEVSEISKGSEGSKTPENAEEQLEGRKKLLAYSLILIGVLFFVKDFIPFWISDSQLFAVILILIGIGLLVSKR
jgi:phage shock protein PspC (stress-responsive transcriptional regulator)